MKEDLKLKERLNKEDLIEQIVDVLDDESLDYVLKVYKAVCNPTAEIVTGELGFHVEVTYDD